MSEETRRTILIAAGVVALVTIVILVAVVVVNPKSKADNSSSESTQVLSASSASAESGDSSSDDWLSGIKDADSLQTLDEKEAKSLEKAVEKWGSYNYIDVSSLAVKKDDPDDPDGRAIIFKLGDTERYIIAQEVSPATWSVIKLEETVPGVNENATDAAWDKTYYDGTEGKVDISKQDCYTPATELTSKSMTIDPNDTWPITYKQASEYVPSAVLSHLQSDINTWLAPSGKSITDPINIMVCKNGVEKDGNEYRFLVLAYVGADKPIFRCAYNADGTGVVTHVD